MVATSVLETASSVEIRAKQIIVQDADWRGGIHHTREINGASRSRETFTLRWTPSTGRGIAISLRQHYETNAHNAFDYTPPDRGDAIKVIYLGGPKKLNQNARTAGLEVVLEEALASD